MAPDAVTPTSYEAIGAVGEKTGNPTQHIGEGWPRMRKLTEQGEYGEQADERYLTGFKWVAEDKNGARIAIGVRQSWVVGEQRGNDRRVGGGKTQPIKPVVPQ